MRLRVALRAPRPVLPTTTPLFRRLRRRLRTPSLYWTIAVLTGALTAGVVWHAVSSAERDARRYGEQVTVAVAVRDLPAGATLGSHDVEMTALPAAMVPAGALRSAPSPRTLRAGVVKGEVLVSARLAPGGSSSAAARLTSSQRAVAIPLPEAHLDLHDGDLVDAVSLSEDGTSTVIAERARVLDAHERTVILAVDESEVAALSDALAAATVSLALIGA